MKQLQTLLEAFSSGPNRSLEAAREIEGFIASHYPDDHTLQELAEYLAQYCPGEGDFLFSEAAILPKIDACLKQIRMQKTSL